MPPKNDKTKPKQGDAPATEKAEKAENKAGSKAEKPDKTENKAGSKAEESAMPDVEKKLVPGETAIVLIEFQNDFTHKGGVFFEAVKTVMEQTNMLQNTVDLVKEARKRGVIVVHCPITFAAEYKELTRKPYGILKGVVDGKAFIKGSWGGTITEELTPEAIDIIIEGKRGLCGFASTNLDFILRSLGIRNIAIAGFLTNCCVESTMRSGYELGYNVFTLTNCTATLSPEQQEAAVKFTFPMFSHPVTHKELLEKIGSA